MFDSFIKWYGSFKVKNGRGDVVVKAALHSQFVGFDQSLVSLSSLIDELQNDINGLSA